MLTPSLGDLLSGTLYQTLEQVPLLGQVVLTQLEERCLWILLLLSERIHHLRILRAKGALGERIQAGAVLVLLLLVLPGGVVRVKVGVIDTGEGVGRIH